MSYHKTIIIGRLGKDSEVKSTPQGKQVANFSVAVEEGFGEKKYTEWYNIVAWEKLAELVGQYLKKGALVAVEAKKRTRSWDDRETGKKVYREEFIAVEVRFLDKRTEDSVPSETKVPSDPVAGTEITDDDIPW